MLLHKPCSHEYDFSHSRTGSKTIVLYSQDDDGEVGRLSTPFLEISGPSWARGLGLRVNTVALSGAWLWLASRREPWPERR